MATEPGNTRPSPDEKGLFDWYFELQPLSPEAREPHLRSLDASNPSLARELRRMLDVHSQMPSIDVPNELTNAPAEVDLPEGTVLASRYRIVRKLGEGGYGVVYLADQIDDVKRPVAIKLLRRPRPRGAVRRRAATAREDGPPEHPETFRE